MKHLNLILLALALAAGQATAIGIAGGAHASVSAAHVSVAPHVAAPAPAPHVTTPMPTAKVIVAPVRPAGLAKVSEPVVGAPRSVVNPPLLGTVPAPAVHTQSFTGSVVCTAGPEKCKEKK